MSAHNPEPREPKVLFYDIEVMAHLGYVYKGWEANVLKFERYGFIFSFAYKWKGQKRIHCPTLPDFKTFKENRLNDKELVLKLHDLFNEADQVIGHNSFNFDDKVARARMVYHRIPPHSPFQSIDTLKIARKHFKFPGNSLNELARFLGLRDKIKHEGFDSYHEAAIENKRSTWRLIKRYNKMDVELLEEVYEVLKPWTDNHPNHNVYTGLNGCPVCGSENIKKNGKRHTRVSIQQRYQCRDCGAYSSQPISGKGLIR